MRVVFLGTPAAALPSLRVLLGSPRHRVVGVVSQPDRPRGRGRQLAPPPVAAAARAAGLPLLQVEDVNRPEAVQWVAAREPEVGVVVAFGQYLGRRLREVPPRGFLNVHASLLPRYRGAAPVYAALRAGDRETGVSIMQVERRMDAGPVLARRAVAIGEDETAGELEARLATLGAELLLDVLDAVAAGTVRAEPQDEAAATYAPRLTARDRWVVWEAAAREVHNQVRALTPHPGALAWFQARKGGGFSVRIGRTRVAAAEGTEGPAGAVLGAEGEALRVAAGAGVVWVLELVPAGGKRMSGSAFLRGRARGGGRFVARRTS